MEHVALIAAPVHYHFECLRNFYSKETDINLEIIWLVQQIENYSVSYRLEVVSVTVELRFF